MKKKFLQFVLASCLLLSANPLWSNVPTDTIFNRQAADSIFAFGADISWLSQQESWGTVYKNKHGEPKDLMVIMKEQGINALRFRVWVNPSGGWSGKNDVLNLSKRANDLGFKIMIDFHYSDSWADPGKQTKPAAWANHSVDQLITDVYDHTFDILSSLKNMGITPAWVQIGNETKRGMLWPEGNTDNTNGMSNFAKMVNSGYKAIKDVDSTMQAIVHLPDGHDNGLYRKIFDGLKQHGATWDIIGMSSYPRWSHLEWPTQISRSVANMKDLVARYNTPVMVVETGHYWHKPYEANNFLVELMDTMMTFGGLGAFYWEPEAMDFYELGAWDAATKQPTLAMDAFLGLKHTDPATIINVELVEPKSDVIYSPDKPINLIANATHKNGAIAKVAFFVNKKQLAEVTSQPYAYEMPNPGVGVHSIYVVATDTNEVAVSSETVTILVATAAIFQENTEGYCGITDNAGTIDTNHLGFTGVGFINGDNKLGGVVNWAVNFTQPGNYSIQFRYAASSARPGSVAINGTNLGTVAFPSTGAWTNWNFSSINYQVSTAGRAKISLTSTTAEGLPNIDYLSIVSLDNGPKAEASECIETGILNLTQPGKKNHKLKLVPSPIHDLINIKSEQQIDCIEIFNLQGVLVKTMNPTNPFEETISCHDLHTGLYLLKATSGTETQVVKFHIQK